jgi:hypothetical protein
VADRPRRAPRALLLAVGLLGALLAATLVAACGGSATSDDPLAGYWVGGSTAKPILVHIVKDGDTYSARANPDTPLGTTILQSGSLMVDTHAVTMTFTPAADGTLTLSLGGQAFAKARTLTLRRADETAYADAAVKYGLAAIRNGLMMWARGGGKTFPPPREVNANGLLSKMVIPWPTNLFSGQAMQPSNDKGDYTYTLTDGGKRYILVGHLSDGSTTTGQ